MMFFDFQGQKVMLKAEFEGTPGFLAQEGIIFGICMVSASSLSSGGPTRTPNEKVMTVLVNIGPFYGSP